MLIFVSDLHMVDHPKRESFRPEPMFEAIRSRLHDVDTAQDPVTLVLLGDIFELLKSDVWLDRDVRPWDRPSQSLALAAMSVLQGIRDNAGNAGFFQGLQELRREFGVSLVYLPGNHDGLLADAQVPGLRAMLRQLIPGLDGNGDEAFRNFLVDEQHGVVAEHGHQLDSFNRPTAKSKRFVPGDAVVIEVLVALPRYVREARHAPSEFAEEFDFLHEMDNVEPQDLSGLMRWLEFWLQDCQGVDRASWEDSVAIGLRQCAARLKDAMRANGAQRLVGKVLQAFTSHWLFTRVALLRKLARIPTGAGNEFAQVAKRVGIIAPWCEKWAAPPDLFIAGHTHVPLQQVFSTARGQQITYLNTGTWRRVQSPVRKFGRVAFREAYHEALVFVHRRTLAAQNGRYELRRYVRGR